MNEEGGDGEAVRSKRGNSTSQLCVSLHPLQLFPSVCLLPCCPVTSSYQALCYARAWPSVRCSPGTRRLLSPCSFMMRTRLRDGCLPESSPLPLQQRKKRTPANAISLRLDPSAVTGHVFVSLTVWPLGCWRVPRLHALLPWSFPGAAVLAVPLQSRGAGVAGSCSGCQHGAGSLPALRRAVPG